MLSNTDKIILELSGMYGSKVSKDLSNIIKLYEYYDGKKQHFTTNSLDYKPTVKVTNIIKKLIDEEARFLFGKSPTLKIDDEQMQEYLDDILNKNLFQDKLIKAARDCFIGKRVALKLSYDDKNGIMINFVPSLEFVFYPRVDNVSEIEKIIFFYLIKDDEDAKKQRYFKQKYYMNDNKCLVDEYIYNGAGEITETINKEKDTGLDFIPCYVVINDALTGEMDGQSDVAELISNQEVFNHISSDDIDSLKFNMFPQTVAVDIKSNSLANMVIAPGALIDAKTDDTNDAKTGQMFKLESSFAYGDKVENTLNRIKNEMYETLNIPNLSMEQLKGIMTSGKSMRALYWQLITRCEEKFLSWEVMLDFMIRAIFEMSKVYKSFKFTDDYKTEITNRYPLIEDKQEEKQLDIQEVNARVKSIKSYLKKHTKLSDDEIEEEIKQIITENEMMNNSHQMDFME